ncbi:coenzyme F390 synthetase [Lentzea sp. NBRC 105346]|uniref:phenylacetate--CoA ligase family protein n=1 Tax=Lentzea sp. NBRC 105346 TaxID=3032205 RepID=UPI0024A398E9|nr:AMP-binding protein [Lentzea sp. NBRC 105346]GLZ35163.1 coenzyme F390 synthetase [Lentzea sp. NBRC 105346]
MDHAELCRRYYAHELSQVDLQQWHAERLDIVLRHVREKSPFYKEHLKDDLPFTTKADLRRELHNVLSGDVSEAAIYYETTGTTGTPTPCPRSAKDIEWSNLHVERSWRHMFAHHFGERMPVIGLMGPSELYAFGDTFGDVAQRMSACHAKIWPESSRVGFAKALRLIKELNVEVIACAPTLCLNLAKAALHHGYRLEDLPIKLFLVLGEICTPEFAANVRSIWGADVLPGLYGSQEALAIATGCVRNRLHLSEPNYLVEVLDSDPSGAGELCLTMLIDGIKPLIRYRTGDLVRVGGSCDCGMPGRVVEVIGRVDDRISLGDGQFQPAEIESAILQNVTGCLGYQVEIDEGDRVTVRLDLLDGNETLVRQGIVSRLRTRFGVGADIAVDAELDPITNTGAFVSWKAARIKDNRTAPDHVVEAARAAAARHSYTT